MDRKFIRFWDSHSRPNRNYNYDFGILIPDAIYLEGRQEAVLIGRTLSGVIYWFFAPRENYWSWSLFFRSIKTPRVIVCDGQKGILASIKEIFPEIRIQRCHFHILLRARTLLTRNPRTEVGISLKLIIKKLNKVRTRRQKRKWIRKIRRWDKRHSQYLKQRSFGIKPDGKLTWWYTHKRLRACRSLVNNALPHLFTYIGHYQIPRTTNHVEGGINSRFKELLHRHRGLSTSKKKVLVSHFLHSKQTQKPPQSVY